MNPIDILMVEDNPDDVELLLASAQRSRLANRIHVESSGEGAIDYLHSPDGTSIELVLLDWNLPGIDGDEVLARIKGDDDLRHIPVVVLTASKEESNVLAAYRSNAAAYVTKPVGLDGFGEIVRSIEGFWLSIVRLPGPR
ncbi:MAG TPA: response regulator [Acidimicrobiales bacterium]|nr:response regulator [Acidimicrobiales bacterium]